MKRTMLAVLCLSVALPVLASGAAPRRTQHTLGRCVSLEHRGNGWQMEILCREGKGTIVRIDADGKRLYRGTGIFESSTEQELEATYQSLLPKDDSPLVLMQLG